MNTRQIKYALCALLIALLFLQACNKNIESRNPSLLIYPNSENIYYKVSGSVEQISFKSEIEYPAHPIIEWLKKDLKAKGWQPLKESFLNPGIPSSIVKGWESYIDQATNPNQKVHQWITDWSNPSGDILTYGLQYRYPENGDKNMNTIFVYGNYMPKEVAEKASEMATKQNSL